MSRLRTSTIAVLVISCMTACSGQVTDPVSPNAVTVILPDTAANLAVTSATTGCSPTPAASSLKADAAATSVSVKITLPIRGCSSFRYRVKEATSVSWASVRGTQPVRGTQTLRVTLSRNLGAERTARFLITDEGGRKTLASFRVTQMASPCVGSVSPAQISGDERAGSFTVSLAVGRECSWQVSSDASFVTPSPKAGRGSASITLKVPNAATSRAARLSFTDRATGRQIAVVQLTQSAPTAVPCGINVSPTSHSTPASGSSMSSDITPTNAACLPTIVTTVDWLTTSARQVSGNSTLTISAAANTGALRQGAVQFLHPSTGAVLGTITVTQDGTVTNPCSRLTLSSRKVQVTAAAQSVPVQVTAPAGCAGTASSNATWSSVTPRSFTGGATLNVIVSANASTTSARTATITVRLASGANASITITQAAVSPPCTGTIRSTPSTFPTPGGSASLAVSTTGNCGPLATAVSSNWITASMVSASTLRITVSANAATTSRTGTVHLLQASTGAVLASLSIAQSGAPAPTPGCAFAVTPAALTATTAFTPFQFVVSPTQPCNPWSAVSSDSWIQITSGNQYNGAATILGSVHAHAGVNPRGGAITLRGNDGTSHSIPVTQQGNGVQPPVLQVSPAQLVLDNSFQQPVVRVTTTLCYAITLNATWIAIRGGTQLCGSQSVTLDVSFNTGAARSTVVFFGGTAVSVMQAGTR